MIIMPHLRPFVNRECVNVGKCTWVFLLISCKILCKMTIFNQKGLVIWLNMVYNKMLLIETNGFWHKTNLQEDEYAEVCVPFQRR